jgi:hypothetical protein
MSIGGSGQATGANSRDRRERRRFTLPIVAVALVVMAGTLVLGHRSNPKPPPLATSCTTPALALSTASVHHDHSVAWSATGPAGMDFVIDVGVQSLAPTSAANTVHAVPDPGLTTKDLEQASKYTTMSPSCTAHSTFAVQVDAGRTYNVRLFRLTHSGTTISAVAVATRTLTVR